VYSVFEILQLSRRRLKAVVKGWPTRNVYTVIKAATYHQLAIEKTAGGYAATIVLDV
jgi:SHS2 domain-containing protein